MLNRLPDYVDPIRLALSGQMLTGQLPLSSLLRLAPYLANTQGMVNVTLGFALEALPPAREVALVHGHIQTHLALICQRCLEPMQHDMDLRMTLGVIKTMADADHLAPDCEPLLMEDGNIYPAAAVEDELILALPLVPVHPECQPQQGRKAQAGSAADVKKNPFAVLATLKK